MTLKSTRCGIWLICGALLLGLVYPLSLGPVLWYHKHPQGDGFSKPTLRVLNTFYAPLECVFETLPPTRRAFDAYCVWLWTEWSDQRSERHRTAIPES